LDFSRILLIPSARPPHKPEAADLAPPEDRLAMCQIVAAENPLFHVSDIEIQRTLPSYTIDTARELKQQGMKRVSWLIGADMLNFLPQWHEPLKLLSEVNFIVIARPGLVFEWSTLPEPFQMLREHVVEAPLVDVSATKIRERVKRRQSIDQMVPAQVADYIGAHGLYR
jgi:nicotinate-nucleotide adenylyltransferase